MNTALMFSKKSDEWRTPQSLFEQLHAEFGFELDVAATAANAKCAEYFTKDDDALARDWGGRVCFLNPPYSQCRAFVAKAATEAAKGATVVVLVPARTDTRWNGDRAHDEASAHAVWMNRLSGVFDILLSASDDDRDERSNQ